jgi:hypothetical protein
MTLKLLGARSGTLRLDWSGVGGGGTKHQGRGVFPRHPFEGTVQYSMCGTEAISTNSSRTLFTKCSLAYSYLLGRVGGGDRGRRTSLLLPPPTLSCRTRYCTSVQFPNFVRELLVNIASVAKCTTICPCSSRGHFLLALQDTSYYVY